MLARVFCSRISIRMATASLGESEREAARDARRAQHRERFEARLAEADTDGNGELSREEKLAARELHRERVQARRDEIRGAV